MNKEHIYGLKNRFPSFFKNPVEISCGDGWYDLIFNLCLEIQKIIAFKSYMMDATKEDFYVVQIKEKFRGLRFYVSVYDADIDRVIAKYEDESFHICEECGNGDGNKKQSGGWIKTLCNECASNSGYK